MDRNLPLYQLIHSGASVYLTRIETVNIHPDEPGKQRVVLTLASEETLFGPPGEPLFQVEFTRPEGETAREKFRDPVWGRVELEEGEQIFLVDAAPTESSIDPLYADHVQQPNDSVLETVRSILAYKQELVDNKARRDRYANWLIGAEPVEKLFAAEALAREQELGSGDPEGFVARAFTRAAQGEESIFVRMTVASLMIDNFYRQNIGREAKRIVLNALIQFAEEDDSMQDFALDRLSTLSLAELQVEGVRRSDKVARRLQDRLADETSPEVRDHLLKLIKILRGEALT